MKIIIVENASSGKNGLTLLQTKAGQGAAKFKVQPAQNLSISVDDQPLGYVKAGEKKKYKLVKHEEDLWVVDIESDQAILELTGFYETPDVVVAGDDWVWAADAPLQQKDGGVVAWLGAEALAASSVVAPAAVAASSGAVASAALSGFGPVGAALGGLVAIAAQGGGGGGGNASPSTDNAQDLALAAISAAAEANNATGTTPSAATYGDAGVTGVTAANLAAINDVLNSAAINGEAVDTTAEIQALVNSYNAVLAAADTTDGNATGSEVSAANLAALGVNGVTAGNIAAVQAAIAATANDGSGVDTLAELQAVVDAATRTVISGTVSAGPVIAGHQLTVTAYKADGSIYDTSELNPDGSYTFTQDHSDYAGSLLLVLTDGAVDPDYRDEATGSNKSLNTQLRAVLDIPGPGTYNININPLTELAVRQMGLGENDTAVSVDASAVVAAYALIGTAFGVSDINTVVPVLVNSGQWSKDDGLDNAEIYGIALAALSAVDVTTGGVTNTLNIILPELSATGMSQSAKDLLTIAVKDNFDNPDNDAANDVNGVDIDLSPADLDNSGIADTPIEADPRILIAIQEALDAIQTAAENNTATATAPSAATYAVAGVTGVTTANLAAINSALDSASVNGAAVDTAAKIQTLVNSYNAILGAADGTAGNASTLPAAQDYANIGVTGVDNAAKVTLLGSVVDAAARTAVDTIDELQALADSVAKVLAAANATDGTADGSEVSKADLDALGITGVTTDNLAAIQAAIAATSDDGSGVDTLAELQAVVTTLTQAAVSVISAAAQADSATDATPDAATYATAGVTGVNADNLAAINSALNTAAVNGAAVDTTAEIQALVDAYKAILASADGADDGDANPTAAQYAAVGVTGMDTAAEVSLLGDIVDASASTAVDTSPELQALADSVAAVMAGAAGTSGEPTLADLTALGITGVTTDNLPAIQAAIAATSDDGTDVDTVAKLQTVVSDAATAAAAAVSAISAAAEANSATDATPTAATYATAGVTGVDANNLAAINSALNTATVNGAATDTTAEIQALVNAYNAILASADGAHDGDTRPTAAQYATVGVTGVDTAAEVSLLGDVVDASTRTAVDTVPELQALADAVSHVVAAAASSTGTEVGIADFQALGITGVTSDNLASIQELIASTNDSGSAVNTVEKIQMLVDTGDVNAVNALTTISDAAEANSATDATPDAATYATAGVTGVNADNLAAINSALNTAAVNGAAVDTTAKIQALVDAYKAILASADGADDGDANPTAAQYAAVGVTGMDTAAEVSLLGDIVDASASTAVDTAPELQALADSVAAVMAAANAADGTANGSEVSKANLDALGITGVTTENLAAIQAAIAATSNGGTDVDTVAKLQAVVTTVVNALDKIAAYAQSNSGTAPVADDYTAAGVTGIGGTGEPTVAQINTVLASTPLEGTEANSQSEVQAIVDAYQAVRTLADNTNNVDSAASPLTNAELASLGLDVILPSGSTAAIGLFTDAVDNATDTEVDTYTKLAALAQAAANVMTAAGGTGTAVSKDDLVLLGITGVTDDNLAAVQAAIAAAASDADVDTLPELQAVVTTAVNALNKIAAYAQDNGETLATYPAPVAGDYTAAGVTGIGGTGKPTVAQINTVLASVPLEGAEANSQSEVQAIVDAYQAVLTLADNADNVGSAANPLTDAQLVALGLDVILPSGSTAAIGLFTDAVDNATGAEVDTYTKLAALAAAAKVTSGYATAGTDTAPTVDQLNALLGTTDVTADNLSAVLAAIAAANTTAGTSTVDTWQELSDVVSGAIADYTTALGVIEAYAQDNGGAPTNSPAPIDTDYAAAGVTGIGGTDEPTVAQINTVLASVPLVGTEANSQSEVQAIVDAYQKVLDLADNADNGSISLSAADVVALGLDKAADGTSTLIDTTDAETMALLTDAFDVADKTATPSEVVDYAALAAIAAAVKNVMAAADATDGTTDGSEVSAADLAALGITGVTTDNIAAIQAAIAATSNDGTDVDTVAKLQAVVTTAVNALDKIATYAQDNGGAPTNSPAPIDTDYTAAGVTGIGGTGKPTVAQINTVLASVPLEGAEANSQSEVQAIVDAYQAVLTLANNTDDVDTTYTANQLTDAQLVALGLDEILPSGSTDAIGLFTDAVDNADASAGDVSDYAKLAALAQAAADVMTAAGGTGTDVSKADLQALGVTGVTDDNLAAVQAAIAAAASDADVDTLPELQAVVTAAVNALAKIAAYADNNGTNTTTYPAPVADDYTAAGVTGIGGTGEPTVAQINTVLASTPLVGTEANSQSEVQAIVDAYQAVLTLANNTDDVDTTDTANQLTDAQLVALGLDENWPSGSTAAIGLFTDAVENATDAEVDTYTKLAALAAAAKATSGYTGTETAPTVDQLNALLGTTDVTSTNLAAIAAAIAAANTDSDTSKVVDTLPELQALVDAYVFKLDAVEVVGASVTLTYNKALDATSVLPTTGDFVVKVGGSDVTISSLSVSGNTVTLTLATAVTSTDTVTVTYTDIHPGVDDPNGVIQSTSATGGLDAPSFENQTATNKTVGPILAADLQSGIGGFAILGSAGSDAAGTSVSSAGDVNGDGVDDFIVGAPYADITAADYVGKAYVVFGSTEADAWSSPVSLSDLDGGSPTRGFAIIGNYWASTPNEGDNAGYSVSAAGDINGDGLADLLVGARMYGQFNAGNTYVVYGKADSSAVQLSAIDAGTYTQGFDVRGVCNNNSTYTGSTVSAAGDVNGDGYADLLIAAPGITSNVLAYGRVFVWYGVGTTGDYPFILNDVRYALNGMAIYHHCSDGLGQSASMAGDVNGDGLADIIVGEFRTGNTFVVFGQAKPADINLSNFDSSQGFIIHGSCNGDSAGYSVSAAGDVNGDGLADLIVGATMADVTGTDAEGKAYVVFGKSTDTATIELSDIEAGTGGFVIRGSSSAENAGYKVANAGDVNGDGLADLIVTAYQSDITGVTDVGKAYVVYGTTGTSPIDLSAVAAGIGGFVIQGECGADWLGSSVSAAGDINGDGLADLIVGAPQADVSGTSTLVNAGKAYVIFGGESWLTASVQGSGTVNGTTAGETILGSSSADTLTGGGGVDRFMAGAGNDTVVLTASDATNLAATTGTVRASVDGGGGYDTLQLSAGASLDLTAVSNAGAMGAQVSSRIESVERIDMATDTAGNTLTLNALDVRDMAGMNLIHDGASAGGLTWTGTYAEWLTDMPYHQLLVEGTSDDTLALSGGAWINKGTITQGGNTYNVMQEMTGNATQVIVDSDVNLTGVYTSQATGTATIDLGVDLGGGVNAQLINGVQVEGHWYYVLDVNRDDAHTSADKMTMNAVETLFFGNSTGLSITESHRTAYVGDVLLALPTAGFADPYGRTTYPPGTEWSTATTGYNTDPFSNPTYDDYAAIWDAFNGTGTAAASATVNIPGAPQGWATDAFYGTATPENSGTTPTDHHVRANLDRGNFGTAYYLDSSATNYYVFEVL